MKRILLASVLFTLSAAHAAGPQFATPPVPAGVRAVPNYMAPLPRAVAVVPTISVAPSALKAAPAPGSGSLGPPLPRSFSGASALTVLRPGAPAAQVPAVAGSIQLPVFPPAAGAMFINGPREAHPGVFLDFSARK